MVPNGEPARLQIWKPPRTPAEVEEPFPNASTRSPDLGPSSLSQAVTPREPPAELSCSSPERNWLERWCMVEQHLGPNEMMRSRPSSRIEQWYFCGMMSLSSGKCARECNQLVQETLVGTWKKSHDFSPDETRPNRARSRQQGSDEFRQPHASRARRVR